jgi:hypothetical protein
MPRMKMTQMTAKRETTGMRRELFSSLPSFPSDPAEENRRNNYEGAIIYTCSPHLEEISLRATDGTMRVSLVPYLFSPTHSKSCSLKGEMRRLLLTIVS